MSFKEPEDKKVRFEHRIKVIYLCKLSYKKVCKFLYEYFPKDYTVEKMKREIIDILKIWMDKYWDL